jgi:outer membrane receptor protein involved in Fe transport
LNDGSDLRRRRRLRWLDNHRIPSNWDYSESVIWNIKRHTLSLGFGGYRRIYGVTAGGGLGRINYNGQYSGDNFADSLLGASPGIAITELGPTSNATLGTQSHLVFHSYAPYVQDDWKVNDRLTLNLGLRYEFIATPYEEQNGFTWPDFSAPGGALYIANAQTAASLRRGESSQPIDRTLRSFSGWRTRSRTGSEE